MKLISGRTIAAKLCRLAAIPMLFCSINANAQTLPAGTWAGSPGAGWDSLAWNVFIGTITPNPNGVGVAFESWASDPSTYTEKPYWPGEVKVVGEKRFQFSGLGKGRLLAHGAPKVSADSIPGGGCSAVNNAAAANFPANGCIAEEVRRNRATFDYIVSNNLYTKAGLQANFNNPNPIQFPKESVEIKADWVKTNDLITWLSNNGVTIGMQEVKQKYYTTTDSGTEYALVAIHINSKLTPNWVWATFEHELNPGRCDTIGCYDEFGATKATILPNTTTANTQYGACAKSQTLQNAFANANIASAWNHYCLKETQIEYTQPLTGNPIIAGNSVIERINAGVPVANSSCISCHSSVGFDKDGNLNIKDGLDKNPVGHYTLSANYKAYDFVWSPISIP